MDKQIDVIYDYVDYLLRINQFRIVDVILDNLDCREISLDIALSYLTATLPAKSKLKKRVAFFNNIKDYYSNNQRYYNVLNGLE